MDKLIDNEETRGQRFKRRWRHVFGEPAAQAFLGAADIGPGRHGTAEQWARYRDELRNPPPRRPSTPPPGYRFIWYTDGMGMRHRAAVRDHSADHSTGHSTGHSIDRRGG